MRLPTSTVHSMFSLSTPQKVGVLPSVGYLLSFLNHWALDSPAYVSLLHTLNNFHGKLYCPKGHHRKVRTIVLAPSVYPVYFFLGNQEPSSANLLLFIYFFACVSNGICLLPQTPGQLAQLQFSATTVGCPSGGFPYLVSTPTQAHVIGRGRRYFFGH